MRRVAIGIALLFLAACHDAEPTTAHAERERPLVFATIQPLQFFAQRLAGDFVDCELALPAGEDPQHWVPNRATLARLATADMVILHGELESWQNKVGLPRSRQSIVTTGFQDHFIRIEGAITHTHGGKAHTHDGVDPFLWLDLDLAGKEAEVVARALKFLLGRDEQKKAITKNLVALQTDLAKELAAQKSLSIPGDVICTVGDYYAYWARSIGVQAIDLDLHDEKGRAAAREAANRVTCRLTLCPTTPDDALRQTLEQLGLTPVVFDPCFTAPEGQDFLSVLAANRQRLQDALKKR